MLSRIYKEKTIEWTLFSVSVLTVVILFLICLFLFRDGLLLFKDTSLMDFLTGKFWYPTSINRQFGLLPLFFGSLIVTVGAILFAVPLGIASAIYISEIANPKVADFLKPFIEILAGIPSVVFGFFGLVVLVPIIQKSFNLPTGQTALTGSIMLGIMALPTIITISEDAISSVPGTLEQGSLALGATKWQTIYRVIVPAALSGISAAVMLGIGRAIGETMTLMMVTGNTAVIPSFPGGFLASVRTMTATIALEMGEVPQGSTHFHALFAVGSVLFVITFLINLIADSIKRRYRFKVD
ncbi:MULTISPECIES: phosphate ABC transporter permease subunit PstC [Methanosarcina]|uniref:Phosphate transport system permease protein n=3 Tax=Methanosarcina barkeri TaxID=2208 RepID=A0A0G3CGE8_METBA|nr:MULTISPECIES: phosphate ABC transporter permease subunit PstC [Methanosarcina]AKB58227.1 Phosphate transport system permease protein PstC [Methanosarcina barkeri 227]AKJ39008.1 phosphate ABC transporter permease protein PstC [Methanosarcina barkeri CM1]OED08339.1 phosphate ABC transporter permease subunit PstC [Methanosarcina sp. A14]